MWSDEKTDSQEWNDVLAEIPDVDYPFVSVEALQARDRASSVSKFAKVVIFQNPCVTPRSNAENVKSSVKAHRVAERTLE